MRIYILGICGTFMGGIAALAQALGHEVAGSDTAVYPPMSTQLESLGIRLHEGYKPEHLHPAPDIVVIGNALSRGNPAVEYVLAQGLPYVSGPQWLYENLLKARHVIVLAGTHGKTTTTAMTAWILECAGLKPGFLIGGVARDFEASARLGEGRYFVVEADEYDTAFFDKGAKFLHYRPRTAVLNNLEYDHADIFPDLASIEAQFHQLVRSVPGNGLLVVNGADASLARVLNKGCWTPVERFGAADAEWQIAGMSPDGRSFDVLHRGEKAASVRWELLGEHNALNALAAITAAQHAGVEPARSAEALSRFKGVKRRLEVRAEMGGVTVYDDFAHHPTAVAATLAALRARVGRERILAVLEPRSNTMKMGVHRDTLAIALEAADRVFVYAGANLGWDVAGTLLPLGTRASVLKDIDGLVQTVGAELQRGDHVLIMSNGGFGGFHEKLIDVLERRAAPSC
ncbi:MAG TPA: UDP-N-acetylmuramate:L-alanyl-gamma-D-glutamyl-meso-diaminopimelate ligase [Gammaproteobacteria bacterium]|nr:UDP-N-acetylmuramate:L-alanyl-gamma-D-glutamyl-meso-diaminopimelate ligase [Gammaproteobacteria bacterium]